MCLRIKSKVHRRAFRQCSTGPRLSLQPHSVCSLPRPVLSSHKDFCLICKCPSLLVYSVPYVFRPFSSLILQVWLSLSLSLRKMSLPPPEQGPWMELMKCTDSIALFYPMPPFLLSSSWRSQEHTFSTNIPGDFKTCTSWTKTWEALHCNVLSHLVVNLSH